MYVLQYYVGSHYQCNGNNIHVVITPLQNRRTNNLTVYFKLFLLSLHHTLCSVLLSLLVFYFLPNSVVAIFKMQLTKYSCICLSLSSLYSDRSCPNPLFFPRDMNIILLPNDQMLHAGDSGDIQ